jgi:hypothetical protein
VQCPAVRATVGDSRLALHRWGGCSAGASNTASPI